MSDFDVNRARQDLAEQRMPYSQRLWRKISNFLSYLKEKYLSRYWAFQWIIVFFVFSLLLMIKNGDTFYPFLYVFGFLVISLYITLLELLGFLASWIIGINELEKKLTYITPVLVAMLTFFITENLKITLTWAFLSSITGYASYKLLVGLEAEKRVSAYIITFLVFLTMVGMNK